MRISVTSLEKRFEKLENKIKLTARRILKILKKENVSVEIYFAGNKEMKSLNRKYRKKNKIANVLSFEEAEKFVGPKEKVKKIGEIYLNAEREDKNFSREFLLLHGMLHLFGYDHMTDKESEEMSKKEKSISKILNINH